MVQPIQDIKVVEVIAPAAIVDNASWTTVEIDTLGFDRCTIFVHIGATDIAFAALKLQQSDTSGSGFADVSGADFSSDGTLPAATADNTFVAIDVDLRNKKRYLDLVATAGNGTAGTFASAFAILSKSGTGLDTAAKRGLGQVLTV